jgi:hypothetical protein
VTQSVTGTAPGSSAAPSATTTTPRVWGPIRQPGHGDAFFVPAVANQFGNGDAAAMARARAAIPLARPGIRGYPRKVVLVSRYSMIPSRPFSRPNPDCFIPPKGACGCNVQVLTPTVPARRARLTRNARPTSCV